MPKIKVKLYNFAIFMPKIKNTQLFKNKIKKLKKPRYEKKIKIENPKNKKNSLLLYEFVVSKQTKNSDKILSSKNTKKLMSKNK